jgi:ATP-binding protein involved in chromosome partitioning
MRIAVPITEGRLCMHFGHCEQFLLADVEDNQIKNKTYVIPPPHAPGVIPKFLGEQKVNCIIAGGMGRKAQDFFEEQNIQVVVGATGEDPIQLVQSYLDGTLQTGSNLCDH